MASFETWDDLVRQTVCWIGTEVAPGEYGDPLENVRRAQRSDPEQESLFALLEALDQVFGRVWFTAREVCQRASRARTDGLASSGEKALAAVLSDIGGGDRVLGSTRSIGRILQFRQGRIAVGLRLVSRPARSSLEYQVDTIADPGGCRFGRFGGFNSGHFESDPAPICDSDRAKTNLPNLPNLQTIGSDGQEGQ